MSVRNDLIIEKIEFNSNQCFALFFESSARRIHSGLGISLQKRPQAQ